MKFVGLSMRFRYFVQNLRRFGPKKMFQYFLFQRILRINSETPWPVHWSSVVSFPRNIHLDSPTANLGAMPGCYIQAQNGIQVGKNTIVGPGVKIISGNHNLYNFRVHEPKEPITIGENCWIGANAVILPGVKLGDHTIVAAGAVVTKSFLEGDCIVAGVPATIIKKIAKYQVKQDYYSK